MPRAAAWRGANFTNEMGPGGYGTAESDSAMSDLARAGANAVALVVYGGMARQEATVHYGGLRAEESDSSLAHAVRTAHALGLKVLLKPQIWVWPHTFSGDLKLSGAAWETFRESYRGFLDHYRDLAIATGAEGLCVGTELGGLTLEHPDDWRGLVREARRGYHGLLTYSANWDHEFEALAFWGELDCIGLSCYFPLRGSGPEDERRAARDVCERLGQVSRRWKRPVLLTEFGFPSRAGADAEPWHEIRGAADFALQARCASALLAELRGCPWLEGALWWKWYNSLDPPDSDDVSYAPRGKPVEKVLREFYRGQAASR